MIGQARRYLLVRRVLIFDKMLYIYNNTSMKTKKSAAETTATPPPVLYNRLPVLRAERGLSRQELADAVMVNYQTIGYLERGDYSPSLELAFRLSEFFGLPIEAIFAREPFRPLSAEVYHAAGTPPQHI